MTWDGNSKNDVNDHLGKVGKISQAFKYMDSITIDDVFSGYPQIL
jgi:hypothetical protein